PLRCSQNEAYETQKFTFPFKYLGIFLESKSEMVRLERIGWNSLFDTLLEWEGHLAQFDLDDPRCDDDELAP
ncbi:MAG: hypothetical protein ACSHXD_20530, partial [Marinosulfonomonas sp.]